MSFAFSLILTAIATVSVAATDVQVCLKVVFWLFHHHHCHQYHHCHFFIFCPRRHHHHFLICHTVNKKEKK